MVKMFGQHGRKKSKCLFCVCLQLQLRWEVEHGERNDGGAGEGEAGAEHGRQLQLPVVLREDGAQQRRPECLHGRNADSTLIMMSPLPRLE